MHAQSATTPYEIRIKGHLDQRWLHWFEGLTVVQHAEGETSISGELDQAALHGVLNRIRDLAPALISVHIQARIVDLAEDERE